MANPTGKGAGRPSGARSKITSAFIRDLARVWDEKGAKVMDRIADEDPVQFAKIVASLVPKQVEGSEDGPPIKVKFIIET